MAEEEEETTAEDTICLPGNHLLYPHRYKISRLHFKRNPMHRQDKPQLLASTNFHLSGLEQHEIKCLCSRTQYSVRSEDIIHNIIMFLSSNS